ncbi:MAG: hydroxyacylglutathione hydrolase [Candidatus Pelagibacter sp.]
MIKVEIVNCLKDNFSYIIHNNDEAIVIDPSESIPIDQLLEKLKLKLKYILNTHHHLDHVDGNLSLKEKYNCKIIGFEDDSKKIPGIDICLKNEEIFNEKNFKFKVYHTPGHTLGHICYHFFEDKKLFTGDTLFSLSCGRLFEGTYEDMYKSLSLIKTFDKDTLIYFGHEYTLSNSKFCINYDPNNENLKKKILEISKNIKAGIPTTPSVLKDELECNIFLKAENIETFAKLRDLKDNF